MRHLFLLLAISYKLLAVAQPSRAVQAASATCVLGFLHAHQYVREATGRNDGPDVAALVRAGGGEYSASYKPEWCGFTQAAANRSCGLPIPRNGMQGAANAWFPLTGPDAPRTIYRRGVRGSFDSIAIGQKAGSDYGLGIHHTACVAELGRPVRAGRAPRTLYTLAGNEGRGTNAGLHRTLYAITSIDGLSNWNYASTRLPTR